VHPKRGDQAIVRRVYQLQGYVGFPLRPGALAGTANLSSGVWTQTNIRFQLELDARRGGPQVTIEIFALEIQHAERSIQGTTHSCSALTTLFSATSTSPVRTSILLDIHSRWLTEKSVHDTSSLHIADTMRCVRDEEGRPDGAGAGAVS
jgi:hypothetical protein